MPDSLAALEQQRSSILMQIRANAIIALRCCHLSNRFEDYWAARRAA